MSDPVPGITVTAVSGIPEIRAGDDLAEMLAAAMAAGPVAPRDGDVVVVSQKIVSKAEGRHVDLAAVTPSEPARALATETGKDPRMVEVILRESRRVLRHRPGLVICEHRLGVVMANAGVDQSNVGPGVGKETVLLLPEDPDASAAALRGALEARLRVRLAVVVSDSAGRAWRHGVVGLALGAAGLPALRDLRGRRDRGGRPLAVTQAGFADAIASAATLVMGEADEGRPAVILSGLRWTEPSVPAASLVRGREEDLFR